MKKREKIGIIGGAGPMAGALLFNKIISKCQEAGSFKDEDFPEITLLSYPFSDMLNAPKSANIASELASCCNKLLDIGVNRYSIACNTLHCFLPKDLRQDKKFVSIFDLLRGTDQQTQTQLVLCTSTTRFDKLYDRVFSEVRYLDLDAQKRLDCLIEGVLKGLDLYQQALKLFDLISQAKWQTNSIVLGCTELSLLAEQKIFKEKILADQKMITDPINSLATALLKKG